MTHNNPTSDTSEEEELVPLEPDEELSMTKRLITPKVIILGFLSLLFISKNIYYNFVVEKEKVEEVEPTP